MCMKFHPVNDELSSTIWLMETSCCGLVNISYRNKFEKHIKHVTRLWFAHWVFVAAGITNESTDN